jgi:hypothetical protein
MCRPGLILACWLALIAFNMGKSVGQERFIGCGVLEEVDGGCLRLVLVDGRQYDLDDVGSFDLGDTILVAGQLESICFSDCPGPIGCVTVDTTALCRDFDFGCGLQVFDFSCWYFRSERYGDILIQAIPFPFPADSMHLVGKVTTCVSGCPAEACLAGGTIRRCSSETAVKKVTWGSIKALYR